MDDFGPLIGPPRCVLRAIIARSEKESIPRRRSYAGEQRRLPFDQLEATLMGLTPQRLSQAPRSVARGDGGDFDLGQANLQLERHESRATHLDEQAIEAAHRSIPPTFPRFDLRSGHRNPPPTVHS